MVFQQFYEVLFSPLGWILVFGVASAYFLHQKYLAPYIAQQRSEQELENRKKYDRDVDEKVAERMRQARLRQQEEYERVAAEQRVKDEIKAEQARKELLEQLKQQEEQESVFKHAVGSYSVKPVSPKPKDETPREIIDRYLSSKPIVVFSKSWCPFCRKVKAALSVYRLPNTVFEYVELDERSDLPAEEILDELLQMTGARSVPRVFIGGKFIGGCDDTLRLEREGALEKLIGEALH